MKKSNLLFVLIVLLLTILLVVWGLMTGSYETGFDHLISAVFSADMDDRLTFSIWNIRMPRVLVVMLCGGSLALSGYLMQTLTNNPMADPYLLGTSAGASLGASIFYMWFSQFVLLNWLGASFFAFAGALGISMLAIFFAYDRGSINPLRVILSGVALSSLCVAAISLSVYLSNEENKLRNILYWNMGSYESATWEHIPLLSIVLVISIIVLHLLTPSLNLLLLGEQKALQMGLNVSVFRWFVLALAAFITAVAVSAGGPIGFVGLIVPHIVRVFSGTTGRWNITLTAITGGLFLLFCDLVGRTIYPPSGIPAGVVSSMIGVPFFLWLVRQRRYQAEGL